MELDYAPLARRAGPGARLRAVARNPLMVVAGTIATLLVVIPAAVIVYMLVADDVDPGGLFFALLLVLGGVYCWVDIWWRVAGDSSLDAFAARNDLVRVHAGGSDYAGSDFAYGSHAVYQSVRTRDDRFVEVGDRVPVSNLRSSADDRQPQLFLRARLSGPVPATTSSRGLVTEELDAALTALAGRYRVQVDDDELVVLGELPLDPSVPERVREAFEITVALAARAEARVVATGPTTTVSGIPLPARRHRPAGGRPVGPVRTVLATLGLLLGGGLGIAVVMSNLDDQLDGRTEAQVVVWLLVAVVVAVVGGFVRWLLRARG